MKWMQKIMLSCKQATYFSSVRNFRKLTLPERFQLKLHLMVCKYCAEFDKQSQIIDKQISDLHHNSRLLSEEKLSDEKVIRFKTAVNQLIK